MSIRFPTSKYVLLLVLSAVVAAVGIGAGVNATRRQHRREQPKVISKVKDMEVVSATIKEVNGASPYVEILLRNNTPKPVLAVAVETGDDRNAEGAGKYGFSEVEDAPAVEVVAPWGTITIDAPMSLVRPNSPIKVAAALYADETSDGEGAALESMRGQWKHHKSKKEGAPPPR